MTVQSWILLGAVLAAVDLASCVAFHSSQRRRVARRQRRGGVDVAVVLFGGSPHTGALDATTCRRLERALALLRDGHAHAVLCAGGARAHADHVGARMMREGLLADGADPARVHIDAGSWDTESSWRSVVAACQARGWRTATFVSGPVQLARILRYAERDGGLDASTDAIDEEDSIRAIGALRWWRGTHRRLALALVEGLVPTSTYRRWVRQRRYEAAPTSRR